ncbi:MAG: DUF2061 domain-containing protein [Myxococcales bacterium]|nr:DUF2061 domain-containing protein [Myxococcales bacterium]
MESHYRTALKTISWRTVAAFVTGGLAWAATGSLGAGMAMGATDTLVKLFLYYAHERAWARIDVGYDVVSRSENSSSTAGSVSRGLDDARSASSLYSRNPLG